MVCAVRRLLLVILLKGLDPVGAMFRPALLTLAWIGGLFDSIRAVEKPCVLHLLPRLVAPEHVDIRIGIEPI